MEKIILQMQGILVLLASALPLAPVKSRASIAHALETMAAALRLGELGAAAAEELTSRIAALRTEAAGANEVGEAALEAAFERVQRASMAFRAAFAQN